MQDAFSENLRLLCSYMTSITDVARRLGINRSQLNKYLAGSSFPRPAILRKIADFFGMDVHELLLPPEDFAPLLRSRRASGGESLGILGSTIATMVRGSDPRLRAVDGAFFEYYYSLSSPGKIIRTLMIFETRDGVTYYRRLERLGKVRGRSARHFRLDGVALMFGDRVFLADYERTAGIELTHTVLYPDYNDVISEMVGIKLGVSGNRQRTPCAFRVCLQRVRRGRSVLHNLRRCGLFAEESPEIPAAVREMIDNRISGPHHFTALLER